MEPFSLTMLEQRLNRPLSTLFSYDIAALRDAASRSAGQDAVFFDGTGAAAIQLPVVAGLRATATFAGELTFGMIAADLLTDFEVSSCWHSDRPAEIGRAFGLMVQSASADERLAVIAQLQQRLIHTPDLDDAGAQRNYAALLELLRQVSLADECSESRLVALCEAVIAQFSAHPADLDVMKRAVMFRQIGLDPQTPWEHPSIGAWLLAAHPDYSDLSEVVQAHHERIDGKGYPRGLIGDQIPLMSQILHAAEAYLEFGGTLESLEKLRTEVNARIERSIYLLIAHNERHRAASGLAPTLSGDTSGEDLFAVLQMVQVLARTGTLLIETNDHRAWIGLRDGRIEGAESLGLSGEETLLEALTWGAGRFHLYPVTTAFLEPLRRPTNELLLSSATYLDHIKSLVSHGFQPRSKIRRVGQMTVHEYSDVVAEINGERSFDNLMAQTIWTRRQLVEGLTHLCLQGQIVFESSGVP